MAYWLQRLAPKREFAGSSIRCIPIYRGLGWSLYKCVASWKAVYGPSASGRPLGTIIEEKEVPGFYLVAI